LENIIEHAFVLCTGSVIEPRHLPSDVQQGLIDEKTVGAGPHSLRDHEARCIVEALHRHTGHRAAAAKDLGIHPSTLYRKMKQFGIEAPRQDGRNTR
jgi:DNA-binding NtrC family response regulator